MDFHNYKLYPVNLNCYKMSCVLPAFEMHPFYNFYIITKVYLRHISTNSALFLPGFLVGNSILFKCLRLYHRQGYPLTCKQGPVIPKLQKRSQANLMVQQPRLKHTFINQSFLSQNRERTSKSIVKSLLKLCLKLTGSETLGCRHSLSYMFQLFQVGSVTS